MGYLFGFRRKISVLRPIAPVGWDLASYYCLLYHRNVLTRYWIPLWRPGSRRRGIPILVRMPLLVWYPYDCHAYGCQVVLVTISVSQLDTQRAHGAMMASLWRRGDVETSFWRHCDVVFAPCVRWAVIVVPDGLLTALATWPHLFH